VYKPCTHSLVVVLLLLICSYMVKVWSWVYMQTWVCIHVRCTQAVSSTYSWMQRHLHHGVLTCSNWIAAMLEDLQTLKLVNNVNL